MLMFITALCFFLFLKEDSAFPVMYQLQHTKRTISYYYVFHDRVTLFFADNFSTECRITIEILHNFF